MDVEVQVKVVVGVRVASSEVSAGQEWDRLPHQLVILQAAEV